ncbi:MAG: hypothetical protein ACX93N_10840 [Pseudohaliea sp.]
MRLKFLCKTHRQALLEDTEAARSLWLDLHARLHAGRPVPTPERVRQAGTALEAAGIYLMASPAADAGLVSRYQETAQQLIELLVQLRQTRLAIVVISGASALVEHLARNGADRTAALNACRQLTLRGMGQVESAMGSRTAPPGPRPLPVQSATLH